MRKWVGKMKLEKRDLCKENMEHKLHGEMENKLEVFIIITSYNVL